MQFIDKHNIKILVLQETKLPDKSKPPVIPHFTLVCKDRARDNGGDLAFFVHEYILFQTLPDIVLDDYIKSQAIKLGNFSIYNIYIPMNIVLGSSLNTT